MRVARKLSPHAAFVAILLAILVGCQSPRVAMEFELLHREMREMEDYIYSLEYELSQCQQVVLGDSPADDDTNDSVSDDESDMEELQVPSIDLGPADDGDDLDSQDSSSALNLPDEEMPPETGLVGTHENTDANLTAEHNDHEQRAKSVDARVTHIVFNQRLTGGHDFDRVPGDDGLMVVLEPRNADGVFVPLAGSLSVVVLDPQKKNEESRVARWDFNAVEIARSVYPTGPDRGVHLELPWPADQPEHSRLHIFARYETVDGRQLVTDRQITLARAGELSRRWTPSTRFTRRQQHDATSDPRLVDDDMSHTVKDATRDGTAEDRSTPRDTISHLPLTQRVPSPAMSLRSPTDGDGVQSRELDARPQWQPYR